MFKFTIREQFGSLFAAVRLAALMVAGAVVGFFAAPFAVSTFEGYDHGHDTEEYALYTIPAGAVAGLLIHLWLSKVKAKSVSLKP